MADGVHFEVADAQHRNFGLHIKIAVAELRIALVIECCKRRGLVGFERYNGVVEHGPGFRCGAGDWALTDPTLHDNGCRQGGRKYPLFMAFSHS